MKIAVCTACRGLHIFPTFMPDDLANIPLINPKHVSQINLAIITGCIHLAYLCYLLTCKLCGPVLLAFRGISAALGKHISNIVSVRPNEQMTRIAAGAIIASMANELELARRDRAIGQSVGESRCFPITSLVAESAIAAIVKLSRPRPALIWFTNSYGLPKSSLDGPVYSMPNNEFHRLPFDPSEARAALGRNSGGAATATHAQPARVWAIFDAGLFPRVMIVDVLNQLALRPTEASGTVGCEPGFLPASAVTITVRDFLGGIARGMIVHVIRSFQRLTMPQDASNVAAALLLVCDSIIPRFTGVRKGDAAL